MSGTAPKVFISYARKDSAMAQRLYHDLKGAGAEPWLDIENLLPGQQWKHEIHRAIKDCNYFVALLSEQSVSIRGFAQSELKYALEVLDEFPEDQVFVIPARTDECSPSHARLRDLNWVDLFPSYDAGLKRIIDVILPDGISVARRPPPILEVFGIGWIGGGAFAVAADSEEQIQEFARGPAERLKGHPLAKILTAPTPREIATFWGSACAVTFDAEVSSGLAWATIEEIVVVVNSYRALPKYKPMYPAPFKSAHVYYIEMDDPQRTTSNRFAAEYTFQGDQQQRLGVVRLESGKPERFIVRINARTPGIYQFDLRVAARHKESKQERLIVENASWLFET